ncbi:MAG: hypothetical protein A2144_00090 [Chloroflexi bacterium RBG_16_50_9]|nr:MAG: hypothetical protein A2144_00090 [Chloroflexi bacterium RBG_16_50_9]
MKKSAFQEVGGFDTGFWPGEDTLFCLELNHKLGRKIVYDPGVLVYHHRRSIIMPHLKQTWNYARHRGYFARKFPDNSRRGFYFLPSLFGIGLLAGIVSSIFSPVLKAIFLSALVGYLLLVLASSIHLKELKATHLVFIMMILTHLTYGAGFIKGFFSRSLAR